MSIVVAAIDGAVSAASRDLALEIHANLVAAPSEGGTPVDTGWARANWRVGIGTSIRGTVGTKSSVNFGPQQADLARLLSYRTGQGKLRISNSVPYIRRLNEGSSSQAPAGFIEAAIRRAVDGLGSRTKRRRRR